MADESRAQTGTPMAVDSPKPSEGRASTTADQQQGKYSTQNVHLGDPKKIAKEKTDTNPMLF